MEVGYQLKEGKAVAAFKSRVFNRHGGLCAPCIRNGRSTQARQLDHIEPLQIHVRRNDYSRSTYKQRMWDESNVQPICKPCHKAKSEAEWRKPKRFRPRLCEHGWLADPGKPRSCPTCTPLTRQD